MRTSRRVGVSGEDRKELERLVRAPTTEQRVALRARIVLLSGEGVGTGQLCERLGTTTPTVTRWRGRYEQEGVRGLLKDAPRSGRLPTISKEKVAEVVRKTRQEKPGGATQWSTRTLAPVVGLSPATVRRICIRVMPLTVEGSGDECGRQRRCRSRQTGFPMSSASPG